MEWRASRSRTSSAHCREVRNPEVTRLGRVWVDVRRARREIVVPVVARGASTAWTRIRVVGLRGSVASAQGWASSRRPPVLRISRTANDRQSSSHSGVWGRRWSPGSCAQSTQMVPRGPTMRSVRVVVMAGSLRILARGPRGLRVPSCFLSLLSGLSCPPPENVSQRESCSGGATYSDMPGGVIVFRKPY